MPVVPQYLAGGAPRRVGVEAEPHEVRGSLAEHVAPVRASGRANQASLQPETAGCPRARGELFAGRESRVAVLETVW